VVVSKQKKENNENVGTERYGDWCAVLPTLLNNLLYTRIVAAEEQHGHWCECSYGSVSASATVLGGICCNHHHILHVRKTNARKVEVVPPLGET
jgi:hypothetical protein